MSGTFLTRFQPAKGNHLEAINGFTTVDVTDNQESKRRMDGIIALQLHAGPPMLVHFRDISFHSGQTAEDADRDPLR